MDGTAASGPEVSAAISAPARVIGVLFSPKKALQDVARKPNWLFPLALLVLFSVAATLAINQRTNWREYIGQQMEKSPRTAQLSPEQKAQRIEAGAKIAPIITYALRPLGPVFFVLLVASVMMGAYNLLGGAGARFPAALGIIAHASIPSLLSSIILFAVLYLRPPGTVDLENPLATNVGAFLPDGSAAWLVSLCRSVDIFSFWTLALIAVGFAAVNPRKLKGPKPYAIAFAVWAVFVAVRTGWIWIVS